MENCQTHEKSNKNTCELFVAVWITNWSCYKKMSRRYNNESTHNVFFFLVELVAAYKAFWLKLQPICRLLIMWQLTIVGYC